MIVPLAVSCVLACVAASPQGLNEDPEATFDLLISAFNDLFTRPVTMPELRVTFPLVVGGTAVTARVVGVLVDGEDFARVGRVSRSGEAWEAVLDVGNISFAYRNLTVSFLGETYRGQLSFRPLERPIQLRVERNGTACTVSTGPFDSASVPPVSYRIEDDIEDPTKRRVLCKLLSDQDFFYEFFLQGFLTAVQDPLYLLVRQLKLCPILHFTKP